MALLNTVWILTLLSDFKSFQTVHINFMAIVHTYIPWHSDSPLNMQSLIEDRYQSVQEQLSQLILFPRYMRPIIGTADY